MNNTMLKFLLISFISGIAVFISQKSIPLYPIAKKNEISRIAVKYELLELQDFLPLWNNKSNIVIDVRSRDAYNYRHITGAINVPDGNLMSLQNELMKKLEESANVIVYGISYNDATAEAIAQKLTKSGIDNVKIYIGGWAQWNSCKLASEASQNEE